MNIPVLGKESAKQYMWGEHCRSWILTDHPELSVKQEEMPPATREQMHYHVVAQQVFYILKGTAVFYFDENQVTATAGESVLIPPHQLHMIANETNEALEFLVISQPSTNNDRVNAKDR